MAKKNFLEVKDIFFYTKKASTACAACFELLRDSLINQKETLKAEYEEPKKSEDGRPNPEGSRLKFTPEKDGKEHQVWLALKPTKKSKKIKPVLVEKIGSGKEIDLLEFDRKNVEGVDEEKNVQHWEESNYFRTKVQAFLEDYYPKTFGPQAALEIENIEYKEESKKELDEKQVEQLSKAIKDAEV